MKTKNGVNWKLWKRNAVVAAIVLFVCAAVYLNWSYGQGDQTAETGGKTLGEAELVSGEDGGVIDAMEEDLPAAQTSEYFDSARLTRQEARDSALSILQKTVDDSQADQTAKDAAAQSITTMAATTVLEAQIENLVTAKGYADCVTFIGDNSVSVVVASPENGLQAADVDDITDIVLGETEFSASQVKIMEAD